jgi:hypothetical protein
MPTPVINIDVLWEEAQDLAEDLVASGGDEDKVAADVADFLDALVPLDKLVPGIPGIVLEEADDDFFRAVISALQKLFKVDPDKKEERRARRDAKKAARKARREAKRAS